MGILRLLLAIAVYIAHTQPIFGLSMVGGVNAVETFFMISGYYMFMILTEKYQGERRLIRFFRSRFLRIFPLYALIALLALFMMYTLNIKSVSMWSEYIPVMPLLKLLILAFTQITLIGQDFLILIKIDPNLVPQHIGHVTANNLADFMLIPTAWTLSLELYFYALAPWLTRARTRTLLLFIITSIIIKFITLYGIGLQTDFWQYRFFPSELSYFLAGGIAYRMIPFVTRQLQIFWLPVAVCIITVSTTILFSLIPIPTETKSLLYFLLIFATLPFLFQATKNSKIDRFLGEMSYPVYLVHLLLIQIISLFRLGLSYMTFLGVILLFAAMFVFLFEAPINAWRQRLGGHVFSIALPRLRFAGGMFITISMCLYLLFTTNRRPDELQTQMMIEWMKNIKNQESVFFTEGGTEYKAPDFVELLSNNDLERMPLRIQLVPVLYNFWSESRNS